MTNEQENNSEPDCLVKWFEQGFHHILEKIFLVLPIRNVLACKQVSKLWQEIVMTYHASKVPRITKIQDQRIHVEWMKKNPYIHSGSVYNENLFGTDMVNFLNHNVNCTTKRWTFTIRKNETFL